MRYTSFVIRNFKGIRQLELRLDTNPVARAVALVGLNESGKTTILDALDYLQLGIEGSDPLELLELERDDPNELIPIAERLNFNDTITIAVTVQLDEADNQMLRQHLLDTHNVRVASFPGSFEVTDTYSFEDSVFRQRTALWRLGIQGMVGRARTPKSLYTHHKDVCASTVRFIRGQMPSILYFPNFLFDFPQYIYLEEQNSSDDDKRGRFYRNLVQEMLRVVDPSLTIERHIVNRMHSETQADKNALEQLLLRISRQVTNDVFDSWNSIFQRTQSSKAVVKAGKDENGLCYLEMSIDDSDGIYHISERSLGFRWFFVFSLITRYTGKSGDKPGSVFLFDEPASNLHASAQSELLKGLEKLSTTATIIYTTHSHHLINPKWLENTYIVKNKGFDFSTDIEEFTAKKTDITIEKYRAFAAKNPDQTRYFQPILDVLDYRPSELEMVPDLIMVEGKNDYYTLRYVNEVILDNAVEGLYISPGGGAGSLSPIIRLYLGWARNFAVLLDSDVAGVREKKRYSNEFGRVVEGRLHTLGDLCLELKGKALEAAFEKEDREAIAAVGFPGEPYKKSAFNTFIQECLVTKRKVEISAKTKDRFHSILTQLRDILQRGREGL